MNIKGITVVIPILLLAHFLCAQDSTKIADNRKEKVDFLVRRLVEDLDLTKKQSSEVRLIIQMRSDALLELKKAKQASNKKDDGVNTINSEAYEKLRRVLTDKQYEVFTETRENLRLQREAYKSNSGKKIRNDEETDF